MGRAGGGRSGGGRSSGGRSSSSRSSGGHRVGSSSSGRRAGSGGFSGGRSSFGSSGFGGGSFGHRGGYHSPVRHTTVYHTRTGGTFTSILAMVVIIVFIIAVFNIMGGGFADVPKSTVNREKVNTGVAFQNDCIIDEIGWFDNISSTSRDLQYFYDKTGVQPFIYLKDYDPELNTDSEKQEYAENWYEANIDNEGTFLYMYFAEQNVDTDVGYMVYVNGKQISTVMDAEAVDIFWAYLDNAWITDMSTDDMFVTIFRNTADRIMDKSTTGADVGKWAVIFVGGIVVLMLVIKVMKTKRQHEKEQNAETERILNTPLGSTSTDDLADKYAGTDSNG